MEGPQQKTKNRKVSEKPDLRESIRQEVNERLEKVLQLDPEHGQEKIILFAARAGIRVFPFTISWALKRAGDAGEIKDMGLSAIWRDLVVAWNYEKNLVLKALDDLKIDYDDGYAIHAVRAAYAYAYADVTTADVASEVAKAAASAARAAYAYRPTDANAAYVAAADAFSSTVLISDLQLLENPDLLIADFRRKPLWPDSEIPQLIKGTRWQESIDNWISEHSGEEFSQETRLLQKISQDYQSILEGVWVGPDTSPETIILDTADKKPQQDSPADIDYLGRDNLVNALAPRLSEKNDENHLTIGLLGNWGIGKSSVLEQLKKKLNKIEHCDYVFGEFNAWSYEHSKNLQAGIAHEVISVLTTAQSGDAKEQEEKEEKENMWPWYRCWSYKPYVTWKYAISLHGKRILFILLSILAALLAGAFPALLELVKISPVVGGAGSLVVAWLVFKQLKQISTQPLAKELKTYLRLPDYEEHLGTIPEMGKNIKALCNICLGENVWGKNRRLVFFVDDLDRCGVDGIVKTFEAVRLVLDIPWVTVIIAMDQRIALPALACHYEQLSKFHQRDPMSIARDYLAKVIHLPIRLQKPDDKSVAKYLAYIWNDDEFVDKVFNIKEESAVDSAPIDAKPSKAENIEPGEDAPKESLEDIISDINSIDIKSALQAKKGEDESKQKNTEVIESKGFGDEQKIAFYDWLLHFELRNPRQIKRLYNSYNLLWSIYDKEWKEHDDAWRPYMLALLVLEMINEHVPFNDKIDIRGKYRSAFFKPDEDSDSLFGNRNSLSVKAVKSAYIYEAREMILTYQSDHQTRLKDQLEPFVLPAIKPQYANNN